MNIRGILFSALVLLAFICLSAPAQEKEPLKDTTIIKILQSTYPDLKASQIEIKMTKNLTSRTKVNLDIDGKNAILYLTWQRDKRGYRWWYETDEEKSLVFLSRTYQSARTKPDWMKKKEEPAESEEAPAVKTETIEFENKPLEIQKEAEPEEQAKPVDPAPKAVEKKAEAKAVEPVKEQPEQEAKKVDKPVVESTSVQKESVVVPGPDKSPDHPDNVKKQAGQAKPAEELKAEKQPEAAKAEKTEPEAVKAEKAETDTGKPAQAEPEKEEPVKAEESKPAGPEKTEPEAAEPEPPAKEEEPAVEKPEATEAEPVVEETTGEEAEEVDDVAAAPGAAETTFAILPVEQAVGEKATAKEFLSTLAVVLGQGDKDHYADFLLRFEDMTGQVNEEDYQRGVEIWGRQFDLVHAQLAGRRSVEIRRILLQRPQNAEQERAMIEAIGKRVKSVEKVYTQVRINLIVDGIPAYISIGGLIKTENGWRISGRVQYFLY